MKFSVNTHQIFKISTVSLMLKRKEKTRRTPKSIHQYIITSSGRAPLRCQANFFAKICSRVIPIWKQFRIEFMSRNEEAFCCGERVSDVQKPRLVAYMTW